MAFDWFEVEAFERTHLWHPYASLPGEAPFIRASGARGALIQGVGRDGKEGEWIDAMASWWAVIHGHAHPALLQAAHAQLDTLGHVMFGGITHQPAVELAQRLASVLPAGLDRVFLCDSGSVAVEVSVKMAWQYWRSVGRPEKRDLITWSGGYHGDTFLTMALGDPSGFHTVTHKSGLAVHRAARPPDGFDAPADLAYLGALDDLFCRSAATSAAVLVEPVVQGAGGMRMHSPTYIAALRSLADQHDILLICDEIATGFGRTGSMFATEWAGVVPDIICVGKALTGGLMSLAASVCHERVSDAISNGPDPILAHGPTFMANPLACAVACASIDLLRASEWRDSVRRIEATMGAALARLSGHPAVAGVRVLGAIAVIETYDPVDVEAATLSAMAHGVWIRPFGRLIYVMPPFCISDDELASINGAMAAAVAATDA